MSRRHTICMISARSLLPGWTSVTSLARVSKRAWPQGEISLMFSTLPGSPPAGPGDGHQM
jgi:hypothetical protein